MEQQLQNQPEIVYHYCNVDKFIKIIQSKGLWLTDMRTTNDREELLYTIKLISTMIDNRIKLLESIPEGQLRNEYQKVKEMIEAPDGLEKYIYDLQNTGLNADVAEKLIELFKETREKNPTALSFEDYVENSKKLVASFNSYIQDEILKRIQIGYIYAMCSKQMSRD